MIIVFLCLIGSYFRASSQDVLVSTNGSISFFSETPIENIDATSSQVIGALNVKTKSIFFKVPMKTFEFKKALMQEHFNENYIESDKYPYSTFNGSINEDIDLTKEGTYQVTATGKLNIHGVEKERTIPGTIVVSAGQIEINCAFDTKVVDHQIKIPTVVVQHIAEVVNVKVHSVMTPIKSER